MADEPESGLRGLLARLGAGQASVEEVAGAVVRTARPAASGYQEAVERELHDPEPAEPGSWEDVEAAYLTDVITRDQYTQLYEAVHGSPRR